MSSTIRWFYCNHFCCEASCNNTSCGFELCACSLLGICQILTCGYSFYDIEKKRSEIQLEENHEVLRGHCCCCDYCCRVSRFSEDGWDLLIPCANVCTLGCFGCWKVDKHGHFTSHVSPVDLRSDEFTALERSIADQDHADETLRQYSFMVHTNPDIHHLNAMRISNVKCGQSNFKCECCRNLRTCNPCSTVICMCCAYTLLCGCGSWCCLDIVTEFSSRDSSYEVLKHVTVPPLALMVDGYSDPNPLIGKYKTQWCCCYVCGHKKTCVYNANPSLFMEWYSILRAISCGMFASSTTQVESSHK